MRAARALHDPRPARRARAPEPALAQRQPHPLGALLGAPALPGPRRPPVGGSSPTATATTRGWPATTRSTSPPTPTAQRDRPVLRAAGARRSAPSTRDHILFLDGNRYSTEFDQLRRPAARTPSTPRTTTRCPASSTAAPTRASRRGQYVDRDRVEETFLARTEYMRDTGTPIWVGEFGPVYTGDPERDAQRYRLLARPARDLRAARRELGAVDVQGHRPAGPGVRAPRLPSTCARIAPVLEKKARLGVDSWGVDRRAASGTSSSRSRTCSRASSPTSSRYPWGSRRWIHGLVRHILLAEPMVDDFARCFAGVGSRGGGAARRRVRLRELPGSDAAGGHPVRGGRSPDVDRVHAAYLDRYRAGLAIETTAGKTM